MLVLARKVKESVRIGTEVTVTVLEIHGARVRLGIDAPAEVAVHREEIARDMQRAGEAKSLANRKNQWLHVWEQGEYKGSTPCTDANLASLMTPEDASYRGVFYRLTESPNCPTA